MRVWAGKRENLLPVKVFILETENIEIVYPHGILKAEERWLSRSARKFFIDCLAVIACRKVRI